MMAHTVEHHNVCINELCRLCCNRSMSRKEKVSRKKPFLCTNQKDNIFFMCGINVSKDLANKHSTTLCSKCHIKLRTIKREKRDSLLNVLKNEVSANAHMWTEYDANLTVGDCLICSQHASFS